MATATAVPVWGEDKTSLLFAEAEEKTTEMDQKAQSSSMRAAELKEKYTRQRVRPRLRC